PQRKISMRFRGRLPYTRSSSSLRSARILLLRSIQSASLSALFRTAAVLLYAASSCARVIPRQIISSITILNRCHHATQQYDRFAPPHCRPQRLGTEEWWQPRGRARTWHLQKDAPLHRAVQRSGVIVAIPILAGLHHQYVRI